MGNARIIIFSFLVVATSCNGITEQEEYALRKLAGKFPNYEFSKHSDLSEAYLNVKLKTDFVDSLEIKTIYRDLLMVKKDTLSNGQPCINWVYLVVLDSHDKYLFSVVNNNEDILFFIDDIN